MKTITRQDAMTTGHAIEHVYAWRRVNGYQIVPLVQGYMAISQAALLQTDPASSSCRVAVATLREESAMSAADTARLRAKRWRDYLMRLAS